MRNLLILIFLINFFLSCKNNKQLGINNKTILLVEVRDTMIKKDSVNNKLFKKTIIIETPVEIVKLFSNNDVYTYTIDFTGDEILDYICYVETDDKREPIKEYWVSSDFKIVKEQMGFMDAYILGFFNIDDDDELEYIRVNGEEIEIDYVLCDQNNWKEKELFYFHLIIEKNNQFYWAYPSQIDDVIYNELNNKIFLKTTMNHSIIIDDRESIHPKWQKRMPALIFKGKIEDYNETKDLKNIQFLEIQEIRSKVIN